MKESDIRDTAVLDEYLAMVKKDVIDFFDISSFEDVRCPACLGSDHAPEFKKSGFRYVSCKRCSTLFVNPRPTFDTLSRFYSNSPSTSFWVSRFFKPMAEVRRAKIFRPRAAEVCGLLKNKKDNVIGDIGAGFGLFLEELRKLTPDNRFIAIEPSVEMVDICKSSGLEVMNTCLESLKERDIEFDLLTAFELIEHLFDPGAFFKKALSLLKPGGYLYITTLNCMGFDIMLLGDSSKSVTPPHHMNFFNPASIKGLLEGMGFEVVDISTPGKLDWDIVEGMIKSGFDAGIFWNSIARSADLKAKERLQEWISSSGFSSHMRVVARKGGTKNIG